MKKAILAAIAAVSLVGQARAETVTGTLQPTVVACGEPVAALDNVRLDLGADRAVLNVSGERREFWAAGSAGYVGSESPTVFATLGALRVKRSRRVLVTLVRSVALDRASIGSCIEVYQGEFK